ncbi:YkgJ family cysteine cluster protein [Patescibacteria group bacterium]|nr:YkgJ family cysteine cluster protein [Patescibacteria group bacterium]MBU2036363.1 YkgJ family cysteine cluster protein [Patescibacteria group bacterium]
MKEYNPCRISGCLGNCCKNIFLELSIFERKRIFPKAIRVNSLKELNQTSRENNGVYYTRVRRKKFNCTGMVEALIVGNCPHLKQNGDCDIHEERSDAARNEKIGSKLCNKIRRSYNLPIMIPKEPVE